MNDGTMTALIAARCREHNCRCRVTINLTKTFYMICHINIKFTCIGQRLVLGRIDHTDHTYAYNKLSLIALYLRSPIFSFYSTYPLHNEFIALKERS